MSVLDLARIEGNDEPVGSELLQPFENAFALRDRDAAEHDASHARIEQTPQIGFATHAASGLHLEIERGKRLDHREILEPSCAGAIEIDDMQAARTGGAIVPGLFERVDGIFRLAGVVALAQAHDATGTQIERWNDFGIHRPRKFFSSRLPTAPERSGWNCMPQKLRWRTIADSAPS